MRLINTHTRQFEEFFGSNIPEYAILSHTWEAEEITYKRYIDRDCEDLKGFDKIDRTCHMAKTNNIDYAWIDTCCIDKSSSAELSEAINSMFCWYQQAKVCYVYLSDLLPAVEWREGLHKCRWLVSLSNPRANFLLDTVDYRELTISTVQVHSRMDIAGAYSTSRYYFLQLMLANKP
jgi:hypothetical protein